MGDISSPSTPPAQQMARKHEAMIPTEQPSTTEQAHPASGQAAQKSLLTEQHQNTAGPKPTTRHESYNSGEQRPFDMATMAGALPHGGYQQPPPPGAHQMYHQQSSANAMAQMTHGHYLGPHPGSMFVPGYYVQQPQMPPYYGTNLMSSNPAQYPMPGRGNTGYYPQIPFVTNPQALGYYQPPLHFHEPSHQPPTRMSRQSSQGHGQQGGRHPIRRPSYKANKSFRDQPSPSVDTRQNGVRGPPRKPHQSGHAIWIGNLPPQTDTMSLVSHVCGLAPGLQSVFLITKSNCAFANFKEEQVSIDAQKAIHDSKFQSARLVCRLRKNATETSTPSPIVIASGTSNPTSPALGGGQVEDVISPLFEISNPTDLDTGTSRRPSNGNGLQDRFFILKSLTREDLESSVKTGIWATQSHNEETLNKAFKTTENVYLIFSANKSGEYFGFARMTSEINQDPDAAIQFAPQSQVPDESELPKPVTVEAKDKVPKGRLLDDPARGTISWEIEGIENEGEFDDESEATEQKEADEVDEEMQTWGKPFRLQWLSTARLPFYRTKGLRNPWNSNREVKIARDGTELETAVGRRLIGLMNHGSQTAAGPRGAHDPRGIITAFDPDGRRGS